MRCVLDADLLIGALDSRDAHHLRAREMLSGWHANHDELRVSVVNLSEVLVAPSTNVETLARARRAIAAFGVRPHRPDEAVAVEASRLRRRYPVSLPDAYCLATAKQLAATVASFDEKVLRAAASEGLPAE